MIKFHFVQVVDNKAQLLLSLASLNVVTNIIKLCVKLLLASLNVVTNNCITKLTTSQALTMHWQSDRPVSIGCVNP